MTLAVIFVVIKEIENIDIEEAKKLIIVKNHELDEVMKKGNKYYFCFKKTKEYEVIENMRHGSITFELGENGEWNIKTETDEDSDEESDEKSEEESDEESDEESEEESDEESTEETIDKSG